MIKRAFVVTLLAMTAHNAFATCTEGEAKKKREIAWDRASLLEMQDLSQGRSLHQRLLAMQLVGPTLSPIVNWDDVCARYDEITKEANDGLRKPIRTGPAGVP